MNRLVVSCVFVLLLFSCNRTGMKKPSEHLLSRQQVEEMLQEVYLIESKANVLIYNFPTDSVRMLLNYEMKNLFKQYNTTYTQFKDSYSYYMGNAAVSKKMVADITNRLIVLEAQQVEQQAKKEEKQENWVSIRTDDEKTIKDCYTEPYKEFKAKFQWEDLKINDGER